MNTLLTRQVMRSSIWFRNWPTTVLENLLSGSQYRIYKKGDLIYEDSSSHLVFLVSGAVWLNVRTAVGREKFGMMFSPALLGVSQILERRDLLDSLCDCVCADECLAVLIPRKTFVSSMQTNPLLWQLFTESLIYHQREWLALGFGLHTGPVRRRVLWTLYKFSRSSGNTKAGSSTLSLDISQEEIAAITQSSRQYVNRVLQQLEREGLLRAGYKKLEVVDTEAFSMMCRNAFSSADEASEH
ncbi:Crp/Fnr family transcriptional regulator [Herbaspirillum huttiense F1]|uniref:Crp/Fnr family transcriptional regulator n=1 Tax=Herbaspirillum huttiense TaxID=863372 RepID=UPI000A002136|nr:MULTISPECIES: Crp/Fnr family transcriptional regulator [Herbaspirillum]MDT0357289.1 Crp/Fnr family transcriptional regulator [Herbaspirillum huttiense F1]